MANYAVLKAAINAVIKTNGNKEITGQVLNQTLMAIVDSLGENYQFAGVAVPSTNPGTPDQNIFYLATQAGTYTNFGAVVLPVGIHSLMWDGTSWSHVTVFAVDDEPTSGSTNLVDSDGICQFVLEHGFNDDIDIVDVTGSDYFKDRKVYAMRKNIGTSEEPEYETIAEFTIPIATAIKAGLLPAYVDGVFDVNRYAGSNNPYDSLSYVLNNAETLIPTAVRRGGMSIKFIQSSDNNYVQYRLIADEWSINTDDWVIADEGVYVENPEYIYIKTDKDSKILWAIKVDGSIYWGAGVPQQAIDYINGKVGSLTSNKVEDILAFLDGLYTGDTTLQQLLSNKVDKVEGKSLIDSEFASSQEAITNPEYVQVTTDSEDKILEAIKTDGTKVIGGNAIILGDVDIQGATYTLRENLEWIKVLTDAQDRIIAGIRRDGSVFFLGIPKEIDNMLLKKPDICFDKTLGSLTPLSMIKEYGGLACMFRKWGFVGDSLTCGVLDNYPNGSTTDFQASWGQVLCRKLGVIGTNWARGGIDSPTWIREYIDESTRGKSTDGTTPTILEDLKEVYIISLGTNDVTTPLGSLQSINTNNFEDNDKTTFYGAYSYIVYKILQINPNAIIFITTLPPYFPSLSNSENYGINQAIRNIGELFNEIFQAEESKKVFVLDLFRNIKKPTEEFKKLYMFGHLTCAGYVYHSSVILTYIDWIIKKNPLAFYQWRGIIN